MNENEILLQEEVTVMKLIQKYNMIDDIAKSLEVESSDGNYTVNIPKDMDEEYLALKLNSPIGDVVSRILNKALEYYVNLKDGEIKEIKKINDNKKKLKKIKKILNTVNKSSNY